MANNANRIVEKRYFFIDVLFLVNKKSELVFNLCLQMYEKKCNSPTI
jgi:radical SAM superfamily enzyme YgiQ (UPF0313 family)